MWTGGKDSTLTLYFIKEVAERYDLEVPPAVFIDHYQHFDEIMDFVEHWAEEWDLDVIWARNEDVGDVRRRERPRTRRRHPGVRTLRAQPAPRPRDSRIRGRHVPLPARHLRRQPPAEDRRAQRHPRRARRRRRLLRRPLGRTGVSRRRDVLQPPPRLREVPAARPRSPHPPVRGDRRVGGVLGVHRPGLGRGLPGDGYVPQGHDDLPEGVDKEDVPVSPKYFAGFRSLGSEV